MPMGPKKRQIMFERFSERNPSPTTELLFSSPFELLIAVLLSAQATDIGVNKATTVLFKKANTPSSLYKLGLSEIKRHIQTIGLFNTKAANILKTCKILIDKYNGEVPQDRAALEELPGVGRKTANVVLNTAFGIPTIAVDTHIFRVSNRTGLAPGKDVKAVEMALLKRVPKAYHLNAHHWLILHGRYICKARSPLCDACFLSDICSKKIV